MRKGFLDRCFIQPVVRLLTHSVFLLIVRRIVPLAAALFTAAQGE
ncbi:MAG: hypothetical protein ABSH39_14365 [Candidatus Acidiferrum sp.]